MSGNVISKFFVSGKLENLEKHGKIACNNLRNLHLHATENAKRLHARSEFLEFACKKLVPNSLHATENAKRLDEH